ncbi:MAG: hypothetical protein NC924_03210 [Candidatus Omnitrophica bacterium]|nr:hypothetical protein [Candidatus Omnitrophota bacterium]
MQRQKIALFCGWMLVMIIVTPPCAQGYTQTTLSPRVSISQAAIEESFSLPLVLTVINNRLLHSFALSNEQMVREMRSAVQLLNSMRSEIRRLEKSLGDAREEIEVYYAAEYSRDEFTQAERKKPLCVVQWENLRNLKKTVSVLETKVHLAGSEFIFQMYDEVLSGYVVLYQLTSQVPYEKMPPEQQIRLRHILGSLRVMERSVDKERDTLDMVRKIISATAECIRDLKTIDCLLRAYQWMRDVQSCTAVLPDCPEFKDWQWLSRYFYDVQLKAECFLTELRGIQPHSQPLRLRWEKCLEICRAVAERADVEFDSNPQQMTLLLQRELPRLSESIIVTDEQEILGWLDNIVKGATQPRFLNQERGMIREVLVRQQMFGKKYPLNYLSRPELRPTLGLKPQRQRMSGTRSDRELVPRVPSAGIAGNVPLPTVFSQQMLLLLRSL